MPAAVEIPRHAEFIHPARLPIEFQSNVWRQGRRGFRLVDGVRSEAAPIRVVRIKLDIPFGRGPVGNTKDSSQRKLEVRLRRSVRLKDVG